ncbi:MAG: hypothetical protein RL277_1351 [Planctomycetota bacterium]|jgi:N-acetylornithine carbamoyltransferase
MAQGSAIPHLIDLNDWSEQAVDDLLDLSVRLKKRAAVDTLQGRSVGLLFFRASLRTRISFESAMQQLGGETIHLTAASDFWDLEVQEGAVMDGRAPEHVRDAARVLSRYVHALAIRPGLGGQSWEVDRQDSTIRAWARHAQVPVINMESALYHPLQALADLMTMRETLGSLTGKKLCISWTRSPQPSSAAVTNSLLLAALRAGMQVHIAHPEGYDLDEEISARARAMCGDDAQRFATGLDAEEAVQGAHIVYARSWASTRDYGNPTLAASRRARLSGWMVDAALMRRSDGAKLMHAMPVRRNIEVSDEVLDGPQSLVYEQAENRLHSQKALLVRLLRG